MSPLFFFLAVLPFFYHGCLSCGAGSANEYQWVQNPTFTFNVSPPVSWTFFPTVSPETAQVWYFVGQSNNSVMAAEKAQSQMIAAMTTALADNNLPLNGVNISTVWVPVMVLNPGTLATGVGSLYGKVEANALTQVAVGGAGITAFVWQPYGQMASVTVQPLGTTMYNWNLVKNSFMQQLQLNFYAKFLTDVSIRGSSSG